MSQNYYKLYLENVLELAETLVIKSEYTALRINEHMLYFHGANSFVEHDKRTWKYYLNLSGQYHLHDEEMKIISLDTLNEIVFSKDNLDLHKTTASAYQYNSRYYRELVLRYPQQEQLILGILYPVDIDVAINAKDFTVLSYPSYLVEDNEISLITNINQWLENFDIRWNNKQFTISDDWYGASVLGVMYLQLVPLILNLRLRACHTSEAHSFHVREYLASHGMLDVYLSKMTRKQALFFYRNINYIHRNSGKKDTFYWLVDKIMNDRNLPLSEYTMHHDTSSMPGVFAPNIYFKKARLEQSNTSSAQADMNYPLSAVLHKEYPLAHGNSEYSQNNIKRIESLFQRSLSSTLGTKLLESSMVDYTDAVPLTLHQVFINQWIAFTNTGRFTGAYIRIKSPRTSKELVMNTRDAYIYYLYAFAKSCGVTLNQIPPLFAMRSQIEPTPSEDVLLDLVNERQVPRAFASYLLSVHTSINNINTLHDFQALCRSMHRSAMEQLYFVYQQENLTTRGMLYNMLHRLYQDVWYPSPDPITPYASWLSFKSLESEGFTTKDWERIYQDIYQQVTGVEMANEENASSVQKAMVAMLTQLSSYSIQIVSDVNESAIRSPNWNTVRLEQVTNAGRSYQAILLGIFKIFKQSIKPKDYLFLKLDYLFRNFTIRNKPFDGGFIDAPVDVFSSKIESRNRDVFDLGIFRLNQESLPLPATMGPLSDYPNFAGYTAMSATEKSQIKNIYCECPKPFFQPTQADMQDLILYQGLPGLKYQPIHNDYLELSNYYYIPDSSYHFIVNGQETELDAFHPNFDPEWMPNFKLNTSKDKLTSFTILNDIPLENELPNHDYTGGWEYLSVFSPSKEGDEERDIEGLTASYGSLEMPSMQVVTVSMDTRVFQSATHAVSKGLKIVYLNSNLNAFTRIGLENQLKVFGNNIRRVDLSFNGIFLTSKLADLTVIKLMNADHENSLSPIFYNHNMSGMNSTSMILHFEKVFNWKGYRTQLPNLAGLYDHVTFLNADMQRVTIPQGTVSDLKFVSGYRSLSNISTKYSSNHLGGFIALFDTQILSDLGWPETPVESSAYSWYEALLDHEVMDPSFIDGTGIVWG